jgi:CO/xanthine dehydrogenase FAD-binding subunit
MTLPRFEYCLVRSVARALSLFRKNPAAKILSGGTDLIPQMRLGRQRPTLLIDVKGIQAFSEIRSKKSGEIRIGAAVPLSSIASHPALRKHFPLLSECSEAVGAYPLRHRATLAGNICNASPAADTAAALLVLEAKIQVAGLGGKRSIPAVKFFLSPGKTALRRGEILTEIILPKKAKGFHGTYLRISRRKGMDLATVGVLVARSGSKEKFRHRIALVAVAPTPIRVTRAEQLLDREGPAALLRAAEIAKACCRPISDVRGTAAYRKEMVGVLVSRGLQAIFQAKRSHP